MPRLVCFIYTQSNGLHNSNEFVTKKNMFEFAFNSFYEAIYMNGHGIYVWSVLAIVCLSLLVFFMLYC